MGSATREALVSARSVLSGLGAASLETGEQLFAAGRIIGDSAQLRAALADPAVDGVDKLSILGRLFSSFGDDARQLLSAVVTNRWSSQEDLLAGIEELGLRVVAESAPAGTVIESELFTFGAAVNSSPELELAVGSKLGTAEAKATLVRTLLTGKASLQTLAIVLHLVQQPRGRRIAELLRHAASVVADQAGLAVATVTAAAPIAPAQLERLVRGLAKSYGRNLRVNQVIDPALIGGLRVQIGDDVIDGSVATRINELRLALSS